MTIFVKNTRSYGDPMRRETIVELEYIHGFVDNHEEIIVAKDGYGYVVIRESEIATEEEIEVYKAKQEMLKNYHALAKELGLG